MSSEQYHFEFNDWRAAFAMFYRKKTGDSRFCFVVSTYSYASGYWVERNALSDKHSIVYRSVKEVKLLEGRVSRARTRAKGHALAGVVC